MRTRRIIALALVVVSLSGLSCQWLQTRKYNVDQASPKGTYRVKFDVRVEEEGDLLGHFNEQGKIQFWRGAEVLYAHEWQWKDNWEATSIDRNPVFEWLEDKVLRMGRARTGQPFMDEISVANNSGERLTYLSVTYDGFESFRILDVAPGEENQAARFARISGGRLVKQRTVVQRHERQRERVCGKHEKCGEKNSRRRPVKF
jgi:hypothetical protein